MSQLNDHQDNLAIGIDLGTTFCCNAVYRNNKVEIIPTNSGGRTTPSYLSFTETDIMIGESAKNELTINTQNTVYDVKRMMGKLFDDRVLQSDLKYFSFKVTNDEKMNRPIINVMHQNQENTYYPEQISGLLLSQLKKDAEDYLGMSITNAVITVPAYFNNAQRQATKDAGEIAGFNVLRIINEPTAASIAYGINICENDKKNSRNVIVFDLGGGTLDVSILNIMDGVFEVKATSGDTHLGGEDFDNKLVQYCLSEFAKEKKLDSDSIGLLLKDIRAQRRLKTVCETAKRILSTSLVTNICVDSFFKGDDLNVRLSRAKFEELSSDFFKRCLVPLDRALEDSFLSKTDIDDIIMIGGSTRIPHVREIISQYFDGKHLRLDINPDEAVASGAAVQAAILNGQMDSTLDGLVLVDVTPLSLGIEAKNSEMSIIIERNTTIPCSHTKIYSTNTDNQRSVKVRVFEGERPLTKDNILLDTFELLELPPMPRGVPRIRVSFDIDVNGILHVIATEETTGKSKKISIKRDSSHFEKDDIDKMIEESKKCNTVDSAIKATLQARNNFEKYLYSASHTVNRINQTVSVDEINNVKSLLSNATEWFENNTSANAVAFNEMHKKVESEVTPIICNLLASQNAIIAEQQTIVQPVVTQPDIIEPQIPQTQPADVPKKAGRPKKIIVEPIVSTIIEPISSEPKKRGRKPTSSTTVKL